MNNGGWLRLGQQAASRLAERGRGMISGYNFS